MEEIKSEIQKMYTLLGGKYLKKNEVISSKSNKYFAVVDQNNGTLVVYQGSGMENIVEQKWRTEIPTERINSNGCVVGGYSLLLTERGSFFILGKNQNGTDIRLWTNNSALDIGDYYLELQDDGNLVIKKGTPENDLGNVWSSLVKINQSDNPPEFDNLEDKWKFLADYANMGWGESRTLAYFGGDKYVLMHPSGSQNDSSIDVGNALSGVVVTKNFLGPSFAVIAKASMMDVQQGKNNISGVDVSIFTTEAKAELSTFYAGAGIELDLIDAHASLFDLTLGLGLETGAGIKDDSLSLHIAGCGIEIGRKISIGVFGTSFGIDFGRLFN